MCSISLQCLKQSLNYVCITVSNTKNGYCRRTGYILIAAVRSCAVPQFVVQRMHIRCIRETVQLLVMWMQGPTFEKKVILRILLQHSLATFLHANPNMHMMAGDQWLRIIDQGYAVLFSTTNLGKEQTKEPVSRIKGPISILTSTFKTNPVVPVTNCTAIPIENVIWHSNVFLSIQCSNRNIFLQPYSLMRAPVPLGYQQDTSWFSQELFSAKPCQRLTSQTELVWDWNLGLAKPSDSIIHDLTRIQISTLRDIQ